MSVPGKKVKASYDSVIAQMQGDATSPALMTSSKLSQDAGQEIVAMMRSDTNHRLVQFFTGAWSTAMTWERLTPAMKLGGSIKRRIRDLAQIDSRPGHASRT